MRKKTAMERCGAMTRIGTPCQGIPTDHRGRCKMHGGAVPLIIPSSASPGGLYSRFMTKEEVALFEDKNPIIGVDNELKLMRVRLYRLMARAMEYENTMEHRKRVIRDGYGESMVTEEDQYEAIDYQGQINNMVRRIESLELTRQQLLKKDGSELESGDFTFTVKRAKKDD